MSTIIAIVVAISATASAFLWAIVSGAKRGRKEERMNQRLRDLARADDVRKKAAKADDKFREHDDAGWRD